MYWFCHISTWIRHRYTCVPHLEPSSLPVPSLWVIPVHQPQASSIVHWTWTGDSFHIWYYTCFNAISQIIPPSPSPIESKRLFYTFLIDLFVLLLLSFKDYFFIFHKSPKLDVSSAPILPQSVACLLIFLILSFAEVFNFNEIQLNYLCHKACLWSAYPLSSRFSPTLFYRSFTVFHFTFRSMIHFEKIL